MSGAFGGGALSLPFVLIYAFTCVLVSDSSLGLVLFIATLFGVQALSRRRANRASLKRSLAIAEGSQFLALAEQLKAGKPACVSKYLDAVKAQNRELCEGEINTIIEACEAEAEKEHDAAMQARIQEAKARIYE